MIVAGLIEPVTAAAPAPDIPCARERNEAIAATGPANRPDVESVRRHIDRAMALFRFHRSKEAQVQLDRAAQRIERRPDVFGSADPDLGDQVIDAARLRRALEGLRSCLASSTPPALATANVRVFRDSGGTLDDLGAGVYVRVDEILVGRTAAGGVLRAQVPSGSMMVTAIVPSDIAGATEVTLEPGGSQDISVGLIDDLDVFEETDLVLVEARDGVFHATARSMTLRFIADDQPVPLSGQREREVVLLRPDGGVREYLERLFTISNGDIVAIDLPRVIAALRREYGRPLRLHVRGVDAAGFTHVNTVEFRVERR